MALLAAPIALLLGHPIAKSIFWPLIEPQTTQMFSKLHNAFFVTNLEPEQAPSAPTSDVHAEPNVEVSKPSEKSSLLLEQQLPRNATMS